MRKTLALLFVMTLSVCASQTWKPYDADLELTNEISKDARLKIDFLTPGHGWGRAPPAMECAVAWEVFPSFEATKHWCLIRNSGGYNLNSWETDESGTHTTSKLNPRLSISVPLDIGDLLKEIWLNAVLESRYSRFYLGGTDGEVYYFGATRARDRDMLWAEVQSPEADLPPLWMAQAGTRVFTYARSEGKGEEQIRQFLVDLRARLYQYYGKHGRH